MRLLQAGRAGAAGQARTPRSGAVPVPGGDHRAPTPPPASRGRGRGPAGDLPHTTAGPTAGSDINKYLYGLYCFKHSSGVVKDGRLSATSYYSCCSRRPPRRTGWRRRRRGAGVRPPSYLCRAWQAGRQTRARRGGRTGRAGRGGRHAGQPHSPSPPPSSSSPPPASSPSPSSSGSLVFYYTSYKLLVAHSIISLYIPRQATPAAEGGEHGQKLRQLRLWQLRRLGDIQLHQLRRLCRHRDKQGELQLHLQLSFTH